MTTNLQIDENLKDDVQEIKDQAGNASLMSLSNSRVVIGHMDSNSMAESVFMLGQRGAGPM